MIEKRIDTASRIIKATPETIYAALTDRDAVLAWLPPEGMSGEMLAFEPRPGGAFQIALHYRAGGRGKTTMDTDVVKSVFGEMLPGKLMVQLVTFVSDDPAFAGTMKMSWSLESEGDGTRVTITAEDVPSGIGKADHDAGLNSSLQNLARYVEGAA